MHAHPHRQPHLLLRLQARIQPPHGLDQPEPRAHGALGIVLMGLGIAKVDQQAVAQILRNMPLKALDHLGTGLLIGSDDLA